MLYIFTVLSLLVLLLQHWQGTLDKISLWSMFWLNVMLWLYVFFFGAVHAP